MGKAVKWMFLIIMVLGLTVLAQENDKGATATLAIHFSNDIIGYLTPCG